MERPEDLSLTDRVIAMLVAAGYHEPLHRDARRRIAAYFRAHLGEAGA